MENGPGLKVYFLVKMGIFHCYVSLPEGIPPGEVRKIIDSRVIFDGRWTRSQEATNIYLETKIKFKLVFHGPLAE